MSLFWLLNVYLQKNQQCKSQIMKVKENPATLNKRMKCSIQVGKG